LVNQPINGCIDITEEDGIKICGIIYHDKNQNCQQDAGEEGLANQKLVIQPGNKVIVTDEFGNYETYLKAGSYTLSTLTEGDWNQVCPSNQASHNFTISETDIELCGLNFGHLSGCPNPDLTVNLSTTALRRGFQNVFAITYQNTGAVTASGVSLIVDFDENIVPLESDIPWTSTTNNQFTWQLGDIAPGTINTIYLTDSISRLAPLGEFKSINATINSGSDCNNADNSYTLSEEIVGSVDPNDKLVFYSGSELGGRLGSGDALIYRIRFQNVGNYYASRVIILDTLSEHLDANSITLQGESHELSSFHNDNGILRWEFIGIHLADSVNDEPNSHGFVQFRINLKENLPHGTQVDNSAAIQFDYNDFIITNTVSEIIFNASDVNRNALSLNFAPNPMHTNTSIRIQTNYNRLYPAPISEVVVYNALGQMVHHTQNIDSESFELQRTSLLSGMYIVRVRDVFGGMHTGRLIVD
jgi:uncharacterized repeat protein (TIGR01451 family)